MRSCGAWKRAPARVGPAELLRAVYGQHAALTIRLCCAALVHLRPTFLLRVGGRSGLYGEDRPVPFAVRKRPPPLRTVMDYGLDCKSKSLAPSSTFAPYK